MPPVPAEINVRKTARYAGEDCDPLQASATTEQIADALIEFHLEGIRQGRIVFLQGRSTNQALDELDERRRFLPKEMSAK